MRGASAVLIARAPVRISLAGGGTDLESYYRDHGGLVVSTTIDRYFYVIMRVSNTESVQITSSDYRMFFRQRRGQPILWDGDLALPRAFLGHFGIDSGVSIFLASEIPPGTGLGSSGAVAVALALALSTLTGQSASKGKLAELASMVEIGKLALPIGLQDQYASAFGGLNALHFGADDVRVEPLELSRQLMNALERRLMLFFTGESRSSATILRHQQEASERGDERVTEALHRLHAAAKETVGLLRRGDLDAVGSLLHESWQAKKELAPGVSTGRIDEWYDLARRNGALGGKITGAGGGGFLLIYCPESDQEGVTDALEGAGLVRMDFGLEDSGATLVMDAMPHTRRMSAHAVREPGAKAASAVAR